MTLEEYPSSEISFLSDGVVMCQTPRETSKKLKNRRELIGRMSKGRNIEPFEISDSPPTPTSIGPMGPNWPFRKPAHGLPRSEYFRRKMGVVDYEKKRQQGEEYVREREPYDELDAAAEWSTVASDDGNMTEYRLRRRIARTGSREAARAEAFRAGIRQYINAASNRYGIPSGYRPSGYRPSGYRPSGYPVSEYHSKRYNTAGYDLIPYGQKFFGYGAAALPTNNQIVPWTPLPCHARLPSVVCGETGSGSSTSISPVASTSMLTCNGDFKKQFPYVYQGLCKGIVDVRQLMAHEIIVPVKEEIAIKRSTVRSRKSVTNAVSDKLWRALQGRFPDPGVAPKLIKRMAEYFYDKIEYGIQEAEDERSFVQWLFRFDVENAIDLRQSITLGAGKNSVLANIEGSAHINRKKGDLFNLISPDAIHVNLECIIKVSRHNTT